MGASLSGLIVPGIQPRRAIGCIRCRGRLCSAAAVERGFCAPCWRYVSRAAEVLQASANSPARRAARSLLRGDPYPTDMTGVWMFHSRDAPGGYWLATAVSCSCPSGREVPGVSCYHQAAATVLAG